jgi:molecular chaperone GrpE
MKKDNHEKKDENAGDKEGMALGLDLQAKENEKAAKPSPIGQELESLRAKVAEYENDLKRLAAEFDNYKKRVEREKKQEYNKGKMDGIAPFIDMIEAFEKAIEHFENSKKEESKPFEQKAIHEGIVLLYNKLKSILSAAGVHEIKCEGLPNPAYHEVVLAVVGEPEGEIAQVLRKGYIMGEHVIRPAQVCVYVKEKKQLKEGEESKSQDSKAIKDGKKDEKEQKAKKEEKGKEEKAENKMEGIKENNLEDTAKNAKA